MDTPFNINWTFNGPNGTSGATAPLAPYVMQVYKNMDSGYGFRDIQWMSPARAWQAYLLDPRLYSKTAAQQFAELNYRYDNSEHIEETVQAAYVQAEAHFFHNRLHMLTGVRFEKTTDEGQGALTDADAVWQRDANGNYIRTASGARIRKPEAGPVNSVAQVLLTRTMRGALSDRSYDGYYPSLHLTYNARENVLVRGAYGRSYGRPNFTDIIPRVVTTAADLDADDPDPPMGRGTVTLRNPGLQPWTADNFDLSLEYYTSQGGVFSAGVFLKEIRDFFGDSSVIATEAHLAALGLDSSYLGWNIQSTFNSGNARIKGAEINIKQSLRSLGRWGSYFTLFVDATKLELEGNQGASFTSFIPESGNWGVLFSWKRISATARWNYRGLDRRVPQPAFGPDGYQYLDARTTLDMTASYQLARKLSLVTSINNVTNEPLRHLRYGSATPAYARLYQQWDFGAQIAVGIKGTF